TGRGAPGGGTFTACCVVQGRIAGWRNVLVFKKFQECCMKWNYVSLLFVLALVISACDSQQRTYSASNANSAPPPPPPPTPVAEAPKPAEPPVQPPPPQPKHEATRARAAVPANQLARARPMPAAADPLPP